MTSPEKTEKIRDIREWATFAVSIMTMLLIPGVGYGIGGLRLAGTVVRE